MISLVYGQIKKIYIGNKENKIVIVGNDLIINNKGYKGTRGLWRFLTNPNKKIGQRYI